MGAEVKKISKSIEAAASPVENIGGKITSWTDKVKTFYNDVRMEMKKVTSPSLKEVQATTIVVIITVFIFALYFGIIDFVIQHGVTALFNYFRSH